MVEIIVQHTLHETKIFFNEVLHLHITDKEIYFVQSWIEEELKPKYRIEIFFKNGQTTELHYEDRKVWEQIIKILF